MARLIILLLLLAPAITGCFDNTYVKQDRVDHRSKSLRLTDHVGGSHDCVLAHDHLWYAGHGPRLVVLEGRGGKPVKVDPVGAIGKTGALVDLIMWRGDMVGVIDGDAVVRWDLGTPRSPQKIDHITAKELGIRPRSLSIVGNELFISGDGGVVRASDGRHFLTDAVQAGTVVATSEGLASVVGRRVIVLEDGRFVGAASGLIPLGPESGIPGGFAFILQSKDGATVGLMGPDVRERNGQVVRGQFPRMRIAGGRLWILGETDMTSWAIQDGTLQDAIYAKVKGARDIAELSDNLFAMVGSFGRAVYRLHDSREGAGDEFTDVQREPGRLDRSIFDGRRVLAGSVEGFWLYPIRGKPTLSDKSIELTEVPETKATLAWGTATIDKGDGNPETLDELRTVIIEGPQGKARWSPPNGVWVSTVVAIGGDLWVGHAEGITVLRPLGGVPISAAKPVGKDAVNQPENTLLLEEVGFLRIPGPIIWLHKLRTGNGVAWVSRFGGMGVAELISDGEVTAKVSSP